jgi:hypothetical protein
MAKLVLVEKGGYCQLIASDDKTADLGSLIRSKIAKAKDIMGKGTQFQFDYDLLHKVIHDLYDLACVAEAGKSG